MGVSDQVMINAFFLQRLLVANSLLGVGHPTWDRLES
jgi:hypothetical protein